MCIRDSDGTITINDALYLAHEAEFEGGAAAGYGALDRADLDRLRLNLAVGVVLLGQKAV